MKVRSLYHTPKGEHGIGKVIVALTWFYGLFYNWEVLKYNYSHEELWLPNEVGKFDTRGKPITTEYYGECFSSTTRGD